MDVITLTDIFGGERLHSGKIILMKYELIKKFTYSKDFINVE